MSGLIVTIEHLFSVPVYKPAPGHCRPGAQAWFRAHGLSWRDFVRHGIPAEKLAATNDAMALQLVEWARQCEEAGDGR